MKKSQKLLAGADLILALSCLTACHTPVPVVYGPPPETEVAEVTETVPPASTPALTPTISPEAELVKVVYGPPDWFGLEDPAEEPVVDVYGPPDWLEEEPAETPAPTETSAPEEKNE